MAEQTFRSPGFFESELEVVASVQQPTGVPAGIIGTAERGPAFVPITVGSWEDFSTRFGYRHPDRFGVYAVKELLKHKNSLTFIRVLGAGANETGADISATKARGTVKHAGFFLSSSIDGIKHKGADGAKRIGQGAAGVVNFLCATHTPPAAEAAAEGRFTLNSSVGDNDVQLVRAILFTTTGSHLALVSHDNDEQAARLNISAGAEVGAIPTNSLTEQKYFKLIVSSSAGSNFGSYLNGTPNDKKVGGRIFTASLDPADPYYITKVLNTDPLKFQEAQHLLYADFAVEHELAPVKVTAGTDTVCLMTGSDAAVSNAKGLSALPTIGQSRMFRHLFGRYDTRYTTPKTTDFISQPFGKREFDLFHFETITDGAYANSKFKVSIANLRASTNPKSDYGTFEVQVRSMDDNDRTPEIYERYPECNLDPKSENYIARKIGDYKVRYDFDQVDPDERRLIVTGEYPNKSLRIRVVVNESIRRGEVPASALPFGFRGLPQLKTSSTLTDMNNVILEDDAGTQIGHLDQAENRRIVPANDIGHQAGSFLAGARPILPPVPMTFKVTAGAKRSSLLNYVGHPGTDERVDSTLYWGVKTTRIPEAETMGSAAVALLNPNGSARLNSLIPSITKFQGIPGLDVILTGSANDFFNDNKFSLAKVAFRQTGTRLSELPALMTGSAREHMLEAAYIRNGRPSAQTYAVTDGTLANRFTMASLVATSSVIFNRFSTYAKFTNVFYGGFDGLNILDKDQTFFLDRALSSEAGGKADKVNIDIGLAKKGKTKGSPTDNQQGAGRQNNNVASINRAIDIITDPTATRINILAVPGVREPYVTDHALERVRDYSQAIYIMDSVQYDEDGNRVYDDSEKRVDVRQTAELFENRALDNNYGATYFPDVFIEDGDNNRRVKVPASVAACGALAYNDAAAKVWFAPAGFNRGSLDFVTNVDNRLTSEDRDTLYDARINPIAVFPRTGFVIFGQKTLQFAKSALDRINVRRLMLEIKRVVSGVALDLLFEPNDANTRANFIGRVTPLLAGIQAGAGIEKFKVIMDDSNNTQADIDANRLNGRIVVVPTRAIEFVAIDFIITNSGVEFE